MITGLGPASAGPRRARLLAAAPFEGRAAARVTFRLPWREVVVPSQNRLEDIFLSDLADSAPRGPCARVVADRGDWRARLLRRCQQEGTWLLVRGRAGTVAECQGRRLKLGPLTAPPRTPVRYGEVFYHAQPQVVVDVVVYHDPTYAEPWHLLLPCWTRPAWSPAHVVQLYGRRVQIDRASATSRPT